MSDPETAATLAAARRFLEVFSRHDVDGVMAAMTDDCVFESTSPPIGDRIVGHDAVRAFWAQFFAASPSSRFDAEEVIVAGGRCIVRWVHVWAGDAPGSVRGVDIITVRDGKVAEKLAYVKG